MSNRSLRIVLTWLASAIVTLSLSAEDCERRIAPSAGSARTVALAGGDAWSLFEQYMTEVEHRDLDISLWEAKVQISRGGEVDTFQLGWVKRLSGESAKALWKRNLTGQRAEVNPRLITEAREAGWDVICTGHIAAPEQPKTAAVDVPKAPPPAAYDAVTFFKSGVQFAARRDYQNALKEFKAAERISPQFDGLAMNIGVTYLQLKNYANAAAYLKRATDANPKDANAHYNVACLQARLGQIDDAIASLNAARANGMLMTARIRGDPDLSSLRGHNDFETLFK